MCVCVCVCVCEYNYLSISLSFSLSLYIYIYIHTYYTNNNDDTTTNTLLLLLHTMYTYPRRELCLSGARLHSGSPMVRQSTPKSGSEEPDVLGAPSMSLTKQRPTRQWHSGKGVLEQNQGS